MLNLPSGAARQNGDALPAAVNWIEMALLGPVATSIAILSIAALGAGMLWGQFNIRAAGRVALGAFILFGAPFIALQLSATLRGNTGTRPDVTPTSTPILASPLMPKNAPVQDPYAGAAVPQLQP